MRKICFYFYLWHFILSFTTCLWFLNQRLRIWTTDIFHYKHLQICYIRVYIFRKDNLNHENWLYKKRKEKNVAINIYWVSRVHSSCISTVYWPQCKCLLKRSLICLKHTLIFVASRVIEAFEILFESINKIFFHRCCNNILFTHTQSFF